MRIISQDKKRPRLYIAGPMRGKPYYNFARFDLIADVFKVLGYRVFNPAQADREIGFDPFKKQWPAGYDWKKVPAGFDLQDCIDRDLAALRQCDGIYMLHGWSRSTGAQAERAYMRWRAKPVFFEAKISPQQLREEWYPCL